MVTNFISPQDPTAELHLPDRLYPSLHVRPLFQVTDDHMEWCMCQSGGEVMYYHDAFNYHPDIPAEYASETFVKKGFIPRGGGDQV